MLPIHQIGDQATDPDGDHHQSTDPKANVPEDGGAKLGWGSAVAEEGGCGKEHREHDGLSQSAEKD